MAKRRGDSPLTILVMGIFTIVAFGGVVAWFGSTKPILKLPPALTKKYGSSDFRTRFLPARAGLRSYILVEVPAELASTKDRIAVGVFSLNTYYELAEGKTQVESCHVSVRDHPEQDPVIVTEALIASEVTTRLAVTMLEQRLRRIGLRRPTVTIVGLQLTGTEIKVQGTAMDPKLADVVAKKALLVILKSTPTVSLIGLTVEAKNKPTISLVGGRDAPLQSRTPNQGSRLPKSTPNKPAPRPKKPAPRPKKPAPRPKKPAPRPKKPAPRPKTSDTKTPESKPTTPASSPDGRS